MKNRDIMYVYNDIYFESDVYEVIEALFNDELTKEQIIGYKLDVAEKEPIIKKTLNSDFFMEHLDNYFGEDRYDEDSEYAPKKLKVILERNINFEKLNAELKEECMYYPKGETYVIDEEDFNGWYEGNKERFDEQFPQEL